MTDDDARASDLLEALTDQLERDFPQLTAATLTAIRRVPRHRFVPEIDLETAYETTRSSPTTTAMGGRPARSPSPAW